MGLICPTVTAYTIDEFNDQMSLVTSFTSNIHIDLMDGDFAKPKSVLLKDVWWPKGVNVTVHLMYDRLLDSLPRLIALSPSLVIAHIESTDDIGSFFSHLKDHNIKTGIALFQSSPISSATNIIEQVDHLMIFSGKLGSFGGKADLTQLKKIIEARGINPDVEVGWDGGITEETIHKLALGGVDIFYVGGAIHRANNPQNAYRALVNKV